MFSGCFAIDWPVVDYCYLSLYVYVTGLHEPQAYVYSGGGFLILEHRQGKH